MISNFGEKNSFISDSQNIHNTYIQLYNLYGDSFLQQIYTINNFTSSYLKLFTVINSQIQPNKIINKSESPYKVRYFENTSISRKTEYIDIFENPLSITKNKPKNIVFKFNSENDISKKKSQVTIQEELKSPVYQTLPVSIHPNGENQIEKRENNKICLRKIRRLTGQPDPFYELSVFNLYNVFL